MNARAARGNWLGKLQLPSRVLAQPCVCWQMRTSEWSRLANSQQGHRALAEYVLAGHCCTWLITLLMLTCLRGVTAIRFL